MTSVPPLVLDIDGTLTDPTGGIDPRIFEPLRAWEEPVLFATGKAFPYPVALCHFLRIPELVVAENGGVVRTPDSVEIRGDRRAANAVLEAYLDAGYETGWGEADTINRWRETEIAIDREQPLEPLEEIAEEFGMEVIDTGYAYHVKDPSLSKGAGVETLAEAIDVDLDSAIAIGDSINDVSTFKRVGRGYATGNADDHAQRAADVVLDEGHSTATLSVLERYAAV